LRQVFGGACFAAAQAAPDRGFLAGQGFAPSAIPKRPKNPAGGPGEKAPKPRRRPHGPVRRWAPRVLPCPRFPAFFSHGRIPNARMHVPKTRICTPGLRKHIPNARTCVPGLRTLIPIVRICVPRRRTFVPKTRTCVPRSRTRIPNTRMHVPRRRTADANGNGRAAAKMGMAARRQSQRLRLIFSSPRLKKTFAASARGPPFPRGSGSRPRAAVYGKKRGFSPFPLDISRMYVITR